MLLHIVQSFAIIVLYYYALAKTLSTAFLWVTDLLWVLNYGGL